MARIAKSSSGPWVLPLALVAAACGAATVPSATAPAAAGSASASAAAGSASASAAAGGKGGDGAGKKGGDGDGKKGGDGARDGGAGSKGDAATRTTAAGDGPTRDASGLVLMVTPSHLLPDLVGRRGVVSREDGYRRVLLDRMRLVTRDDGSLERAAQLLPVGVVSSLPLPPRLGGGFLFYASTGGGTQMWRAAGWLGKLEPLVQIPQVAVEVVAGFDRLYVRLQVGGRLFAVDPQNGEQLPLAPLPPASSYGGLAFADGWRAVVEADLRGPLATFDAGMTWRPVPLRERPTGVSVSGKNPAINVAGGQYVIDERGTVTYRADTPREAGAAQDEAEPAAHPFGPLGRRPLRAALEDGWPDSETTAVVARGGVLARVSLADGKVLATTEDAYPDRQASCHAIRLGAAFGFVCGEREGPASVYEMAPPLSMRQVLRFDKPRFIAPSGNGALVIRGGCAADARGRGDGRAYCIRSAAGAVREIVITSAKQEDFGVERVVALADGRVVVLAPPRAGTPGQLVILDGTSPTSVALKLPTEPKSAARELGRGIWMDGFEEREPGVLGGWVEAGGPVLGVRVALDGKVTAGELRDDAGGVVAGGRFALSVGDGGRAAETTDGGFSWTVFDLPERDSEATTATPTRACGPAGCALGGWVRVGWGKSAAPDDLHAAETPSPYYPRPHAASPASFRCELDASVTPPLPDKPAPRPVRMRGGGLGVLTLGRPSSGVSSTAWLPFRNAAPPALGEGELGLDNGAPYETVAMRVYAWGKRGADWSRAGRWTMRFDDRFDPGGGLRSAATSASPWPDEGTAAEAVGSGSYGATAWSGFLDPSGHAMLAEGCRGLACTFYAVSEGQPVLPMRDPTGRTGSFLRLFPHGAVLVGETWFFVGPTSASEDEVIVWRADLGVARPLATLHRPAILRYGRESPRIVRRALGTGVGLLVGSPADPGERSGSWYVLPIDPDTGELGEATLLVRKDLAGVPVDRCVPGQDGWLIDVTPELAPILDLAGGYGSLDGAEMRLRLDPGTACAQGMAARLDGTFSKEKPGLGRPAPRGGKPGVPAKPAAPATVAAGKTPHDDGTEVPLAATERSTGRRWDFLCTRIGSRVGSFLRH